MMSQLTTTTGEGERGERVRGEEEETQGAAAESLFETPVSSPLLARRGKGPHEEDHCYVSVNAAAAGVASVRDFEFDELKRGSEAQSDLVSNCSSSGGLAGSKRKHCEIQEEVGPTDKKDKRRNLKANEDLQITEDLITKSAQDDDGNKTLYTMAENLKTKDESDLNPTEISIMEDLNTTELIINATETINMDDINTMELTTTNPSLVDAGEAEQTANSLVKGVEMEREKRQEMLRSFNENPDEYTEQRLRENRQVMDGAQGTSDMGQDLLVLAVPKRKPRIIESRIATSKEAETIKHIIKVKDKKVFRPIIEDDDVYIADTVTDSVSASDDTRQTRKKACERFIKNKGEPKSKILTKRQSMEREYVPKKIRAKKVNRKEVNTMDVDTSSEEKEVFNPQRASIVDLIGTFKSEIANITMVRTRSGPLQGKFMGVLRRIENTLLELFYEMADRATRSIGGDSYLKTENRANVVKIRALEADNRRLKEEVAQLRAPARKLRMIPSAAKALNEPLCSETTGLIAGEEGSLEISRSTMIGSRTRSTEGKDSGFKIPGLPKVRTFKLRLHRA